MSFFSVLLALSGVSEATTIIVPTQQPNVSSAVAALVGPGPHTIQIVVDDTYDEVDTLDVSGMDLTILGTGAANTVIRVLNPAATSVFTLNTGSLTVQDVTITGDVTAAQTGLGLVDNLCSFANDRVGIDANNASVEVYSSEMRCFFAQGAGGAIRGIVSDIIVDDTHFEQNLALGSGGHIYAGGSTLTPPTVDITNSTFNYGFSAGDGGAVAMGNVIPSVRENSFRYNESVVRGGAVSLSSQVGTLAEFYGNTFENNLSYANLSFTVFDFDDQFDTGSITGDINFSLTTGEGGALYLDTDSVDVWDNLFCGNFSDIGGAVNLSDPAASVVQNNVFNDNWAIHYGGGLYVYADSAIGYPDVYNNTFNGNSGGTTLPPTQQLVVYGGGGHAFFDGTVANLYNNVLSNAQHGGGVGGVDGANYIVGDPLVFEYNLWFENLEDFFGQSDLVGDYDSHTLNQTNVFGQDPFPTWVGYGDLDCYPDAFYPEWGSPTIDRGDDTDPMWADIDGSRNDIGFTGGQRATTLDRDGDGYMNTLDCNDLDASVNPGAIEACDLQDNDCDGLVDEGFDNTWYVDADGDTYGNDDPSSPVLVQCAPPVGYAADPGDCDDNDPLVNPGAIEVCDNADNDCNGTVDDDDVLAYVTYYPDSDGDTYGRSNSELFLCSDPGTGYSTVAGDCNDNDATAYPGAPEMCDTIDNDCNGAVDDNPADAASWYVDADGDGYGAGTLQTGCTPPSPQVTQDGDCDESDPAVNPAADELCDGVDNDCDGVVDDDPANDPTATTYYADSDGDGFLDENDSVTLCPNVDPPDGYSEKDGEFDCDPTDETNSSEKCLGGCGCQTNPATPGTGLLGLLAGLIVLRRRRDG